MYWKRSNPNCNGNVRDKVALKTTCIKNIKFKIIKISTGCQYIGYFSYSENLNWATCGPRVGHCCLKSWLQAWWLCIAFSANSPWMHRCVTWLFHSLFLFVIFFIIFSQACLESKGQCVVAVDGFYVESGICFVLGVAWLLCKSRATRRLQELPAERWKCPT